MKRISLTYLFIIVNLYSYGQVVSENMTGKVSFISSQNIYVKFNSTSGISQGDTLFVPSDNKLIPVLVVRNLSSTSCVCSSISDTDLTVDHIIVAKIKTISPRPEDKIYEAEKIEIPAKAQSADSAKKEPLPEAKKQKISGGISINSYSDLSNTAAGNSQRFRYTLSFDARNIAESGFSFETYVSFRHKTGEWADIKNNIFNALKFYSLAVRYDLKASTHFSLGRKINPRISNIGSIDGLQVEKSLGKFSLGLVAGSRPDYSTYGFNLKLFQVGGYASFDTRISNGYTGTSIAFMQQTNNWKTDRRFLYFQHSNTFIKNIYFLSTFEIDLYKLENDVPKSTFDLTGAYLSLRYRASNRFMLAGSYDARKNVMYYETYKTYVDRILETETRQGYRLEASYRISNNIIFGLQSGYRFVKSDPKPSENLRGYFTWSNLPGINMSATLSGTYLRSSYMDGITAGLYLSGDYLKGKVQTGIGYHFTDYSVPENYLKIIQNIGEFNLSLLLNKNLSIAINYEGTFEKQDNYNRIYLQLRIRF